jgi:HAD superfamily hydrolase (TIGR01509 family)
LGNRKNSAFRAILAEHGIAPYPGTTEVLEALSRAGKKIAVVSSSRNARQVLAASGLASFFGLVVDGELASAEHLPGKPAPDTFLYAAAELGVTPQRACVIEDAASGVRAGRAGGFGLVVGVDRGIGAQELVAAGADLVITSLPDLLLPHPTATLAKCSAPTPAP